MGGQRIGVILCPERSIRRIFARVMPTWPSPFVTAPGGVDNLDQSHRFEHPDVKVDRDVVSTEGHGTEIRFAVT
jgi:hypothetical protein